MSLNNPYDNTSSIGLATNALQEVSVSTGTFSAEYGNALSGVVNYVTKEGGQKFNGSMKMFSAITFRITLMCSRTFRKLIPLIIRGWKQHSAAHWNNSGPDFLRVGRLRPQSRISVWNTHVHAEDFYVTRDD